MKLSNLFFLCLLLFVSFTALSAQKEGEDWKKGEYEELLTTHPKLYVYPDGRYLITKTFQKKSEKVAFAVLFYQKDIGNAKPEGKLSKEFVKKYLQEIEPFDPGKVMMLPPCCHVYENGRIVSSFYPPNGCPGNCRKPIIKGGKTFQLNCCPPAEMKNDLMDGLRLVAVNR